MAEYFLSNSGNDSNSGQSPTAAWATLAKVAAFPFKAGDVLNLRCDDIWYGSLILGGSAANKPALPVVVGSYGQGARPRVYAYKIIKPTSWVSHASNVWKIDINDVTKIDGNLTSLGADGANIGFLRVDGVIKGAKKWVLGDLAADWDFFSDEAAGVLYVRRATNPNIGTKEILAAPRTTNGLLGRRNNSEFYGLEIAGTGGHGWQGSAGTLDVKGSGNVFKEIGGSRLTGTTRYGNGVECFGGSKNIDWSGNEFIDVYDVAITMQGYPMVNATDGWEDCHFDRNVMRRCNQAFEIWATYGVNAGMGVPAAGAGFRRCSFRGNLVLDTGMGWAAAVRPDTASRSPLLTYNIEVDTVDIEICDNTYVDWFGAWWFSNVRTVADLISRGIKVHDETLVVGPGRRAESQVTTLVEDFATWAAARGILGCTVQVSTASTSSTLDTLAIRSADSVAALSGMTKAARKNALSTVGEARGARARAEASAGQAGLIRKGQAGYRTLSTTVSANGWARIATARIAVTSQRANSSFFYMLADDSGDNGKAIGIGRIKLDANSGLTGLSTDSGIQIFQMMDFASGPNLTVADFVAVVAVADGTQVIVDIYFNVGKDNYSALTVLPLATSLGVTSTSLDYLEGEALLTTLPTGVGSNFLGKENFSRYHKKPSTGVGAPTAIPEYIGQEYVDTVAKVTYRAMGTVAATDWKAEALELRQGKGRYRSLSSSASDGTASWAKIATMRSTSQFARINASFFYMFSDDRGDSGRGIGVARLKIDRNSGLTGITADSVIQLAQLMGFKPTVATAPSDFVAVVSVADGAQVVVDLYFNVGSDSFTTLNIVPLAVSLGAGVTLDFLENQALISALPTGIGSNVIGSDTYMATVKKPTTGTVAPTSTPAFIGQEYIDTTAKKMYKAMGTASSADWVILN